MPLWLLLTVMALTVYRATRLITKDTLPPLLWLRDRVVGGYRTPTRAETYHENYPGSTLETGSWEAVPDIKGLFHKNDKTGDVEIWINHASWSPHWLAELMSCPWCASGWIAGAVTLATDLAVGLPDPWLVGPAVWGAAALLASRSWA